MQSCWGKRWLPWIMEFPDTAFLRHRGEVLGVIAALVTHTSVSNAHKLIGSPSWTWMESFLQSVPCLGGNRCLLCLPRESCVIPSWREQIPGVCAASAPSCLSLLPGHHDVSSPSKLRVLAAMTLSLGLCTVEPAGPSPELLKL